MASSFHKRLTDTAKVLITRALKAEADGERVTWDIGVVAYPDPSAPADQFADSTDSSGVDAFVPALVLYLEIPATQTDQSVYASTILSPFGLKFETVEYAVSETLKSLRETRDRALTDPAE